MWLLFACGPEGGALRLAPASLADPSTTPGDTEPPPGSTEDTDATTPPPTGDSGTSTTTTTSTGSLVGWIGSPCGSDVDCPYAGGVCLRDDQGFPRGTCSVGCDEFCEDSPGYPTTFCATTDALPAAAGSLGDGACLSRCDFGAYPGTGCRADYGCVPTERANDPDTETYVCRPNLESELSDCMADLASRGVPFSSSVIADTSPADAPQLTCHVEEPITFATGYLGVDLIYDHGSPAAVSGACTLGQALATSIESVADEGVVAIHHLGTTVCRTIAGTQTLSRHAYGDAIDLQSFEFTDGTEYVVEFDWEIDDASPESAGGAWLYDTVHAWHDDLTWTIILTPDYNDAHYNHFHVDLTPGSDVLGFAAGTGFLGPTPWPGE